MSYRLRLRAVQPEPGFLEQYKDWCVAHGTPPKNEFLRADAHIWVTTRVPGEDPVLTLALALFESKAFMLLELSVSNPEVKAWRVYQAAKFAVARARDRATTGSLHMLAHTSSRGVAAVLKKCGFEMLPYATFGANPFVQETLLPKRQRFAEKPKPKKRRRGPVRKKKASKT